MVPVQTTQKPTACSPARACWLRAWDRAKAEKLIPYRNADGSWTVKTYTVSVTGAGWSDLSCSCPAGTNHRICKHAAVVAKAIAMHVSPVRGTATVGKEVARAAAPSQALPSFYDSRAIVTMRIPSPLDALFA
jgi:SWIM zinc finger